MPKMDYSDFRFVLKNCPNYSACYACTYRGLSQEDCMKQLRSEAASIIEDLETTLQDHRICTSCNCVHTNPEDSMRSS